MLKCLIIIITAAAVAAVAAVAVAAAVAAAVAGIHRRVRSLRKNLFGFKKKSAATKQNFILAAKKITEMI